MFRREQDEEIADADLSGKKHYLRSRVIPDGTQKLNLPGTVRKKQPRVRRVSNGVVQNGVAVESKTPGRSSRRHQNGGSNISMSMHSPTASSSAVKRRRELLVHPPRQSPMRRVPSSTHNGTPPPAKLSISSPLLSYNTSYTAQTPTQSGSFCLGQGPFGTVIKKKPYYTGTTAGTTPLETTFETHAGGSVDTSSPARFRFTSFPASLPRVNNPRNTPRHGSVRKRMDFEGEAFAEESSTGAVACTLNNYVNNNSISSNAELNQSRDDDGTQNTSISSLSAEGHHHHQHLPHLPAHDKLLFPEEAANSHEHNNLLFGYSDDEADDDVGYETNQEKLSVRKNSTGGTRLDFNVLLSPGKDENEGGKNLRSLDLNLELSRPYDQRRINSFPSSLSSNTHMNTSCEDLGNSSTPPRSGQDAKEHRPESPREVELELHFPLESECSPIPDAKDDAVNVAINGHESGSAASSTLVGDNIVSNKSTTSISSTFGNNSTRKDYRQEEGSSSSASGSTNTQKRLLRPMPDMSAFENVTSSSRVDRSVDDSTAAESRGTNRRLCPPTPQRTPAWANEGAGHAYLTQRQNSLITNKVLLSCPSQVLEGRCSLESSVLDDDTSKTSGMKRRSLPYGRESIGKSSSTARTTMKPPGTRNEEKNVAMNVEENNSQGPRVQLTAPPRLMRRLPSSSEDAGPAISFTTDFEVLGRLGSGAFADVYKVRSLNDDNLYAVKRNRRQFRGKRDRDMALAEVKSMQRLQSVFAEAAGDKNRREAPSSEKVCYSLYLLFFYRAWQEDGYFYSQTELCCRDTCREMLDSLRFDWTAAKSRYPSLLRNLPTPSGVQAESEQDNCGRAVPNMTVWKICHDITAGLSHIHSHGIVHQDIKPSNIFFVAHARFGAMCKIGDFGMAGSIGSSGDGQEGDARYMPPELLTSATRHASSDIFSLGLTLYEIAVDEPIEMPSEGPRWHQLRTLQQPKVPAFRGVELERLLQSMTNPDETKRPSADVILNNENARAAGRGVDTFLHDYIRDVEEFDRKEEHRMNAGHTDDQTPRHDHRSGAVRSPTLSMLLPPPNLMSPPAVRYTDK